MQLHCMGKRDLETVPAEKLYYCNRVHLPAGSRCAVSPMKFGSVYIKH